jgi:hypothetical protein
VLREAETELKILLFEDGRKSPPHPKDEGMQRV